jgi:UDP-glucose 4-epimerase/UDP-glucuronate decarboxylase
MSKRRILITGGGGFIGLRLAATLAAEQQDGSPANDITLVENFARGRRDQDLTEVCARPGVRLLNLDLRDSASYAEIGGGYDEVYHLAALLGVENVLRRPVDVLRVNVLMTAQLLEWFIAGGGEKLLFSSTSEAYAWTLQFHSLPIPTPEDVPLALTDMSNPRSTYAGSKMFGELAVAQYCASAGKPFVITRYHNVYGPRMGHEHVIPQLYRRAVDGQRPLVVYSADHMRAFCFVQDAVDVTISAMRTKAAENQTFNVGNDSEEITMGDLAYKILHHAGIDAGIAPQIAENDPVKRRCPDVSKARRMLNYNPAVTLDQGLEIMLPWYAREMTPCH